MAANQPRVWNSLATVMPLDPPDFLTRGPDFLQDAINDLREFCIEGQIYSVVQSGVTTPQLVRTPQGRLLKLPKGSGGTTARVFPFQLIDATTVMDGTQIRVRYGLVNDGTTGDDWLPDGMVIGDDPPLIIPVSASGTIYLHIVTDAATLEVTDITIETDTTTPAGTANDGYKELGSFIIDTVPDPDVITSIAQAVQTSLGYVNANGAHVYWQI